MMQSTATMCFSSSQLVIVCILLFFHCGGQSIVEATSCTLCHGTEEIPNPDNIALTDGTKCVYVAIDAIFSSQGHAVCDSFYRYVGFTKCGCAAPSNFDTTTSTDNSGSSSDDEPLACSLCSNGRVSSSPNAVFDSTTGTTCTEAASYLQNFNVSDQTCASFQNKATEKCGCVNQNEPTNEPTKDNLSIASFDNQTCQDDPDFRFVINASTGRSVPCSWIDDGYQLSDVLFRRDMQCFKTDVANACKRACGECCGDNKQHVFQHNAIGTTTSVNCEWLSTRPYWQDFYCERKKGSCPEACGICPKVIVPTIAPVSVTKLPTILPSPNPTSHPTTNPTSVPTLKPTFSPIKDPTTSPTLKPSHRPTFNPTITPTSSPSATKSLTHKPTPTPTTLEPSSLPTLAPTTSPTDSIDIDCTAIASGVKPPIPPNVETFETVYSLDVIIGKLVNVEDILLGLESAFTSTVSTAVLCPDESQEYMALLSQVDDRKIRYIQFKNLKKKSDINCAKDQSIPDGNTCEVVEGNIQLLFSFYNSDVSTRQSSSQKIIEELLLALVNYATIKVAEKDMFVTGLAIHISDDDNINGQVKQEPVGSEMNAFISSPAFYVSVSVGGMILIILALLSVWKGNKKSKKSGMGILPSSQWRSDDICYECDSGIEVESISVDVNYEVRHGFKEQSQVVADQGNLCDAQALEWNTSQKIFQQGFKRVPLSNLMTASLVDVDSESSKSDVFDDIDNQEWSSI